jgi:chromatin segregation and condensation protein Rec8/ScpA/Scc1 (kleisin family)
MNPNAFELTLEQQFEMRRMVDAAEKMTQEQAVELLVQASRLLMIKSNVLADLMKNTPF